MQVALFLFGELVFMEGTLQQFLVLLHAVQLGYYRAVLSLIERQLDIGTLCGGALSLAVMLVLLQLPVSGFRQC